MSVMIPEAAQCRSFLRGRRIRVTRVDGCGRPIYGPGNQAVSKGFTEVAFDNEVTDGAEIEVTNAAGEICIADKACDTIKWFTAQITLCEVDPSVIAIMNPSVVPYLNDEGENIGYTEFGDLICDEGFALELWTDIQGGGDACEGGGEGQWGYMLLPWVVALAPEPITIGGDEITVALNGRTKYGGGWGRGPYPVELVGNVPSRMREPISSRALRRTFWTGVRPPEPVCGAQEVIRPIPDPADVTVQGIANEVPRMTVRLRANNHGFGPLLINWGDGTNLTESADGQTVSHTYASSGNFTIVVQDKETPAVATQVPVTVPLPSDTPTLDLTTDPVNRYLLTAGITVPTHAVHGGVTVDWGDDTVEEVMPSPSGGASVQHTYASPGLYTVAVRRGDLPQFWTRRVIAVPVPVPPTLAVTEDMTDATHMTAKATVDNHGNGPTQISWGDGVVTGGPAVDGGAVSHKYASTGVYTAVAASVNNPLAFATANVDVPFGSTHPPMTVTATEDVGDPSGHTASVIVNNQGQGAVIIDWGDGQPGETPNAGDGVAVSVYEYAAPGTYTITATDDSAPTRTGSTTVTIPFP